LTAAIVSAGTDHALHHCDLNDLSRTAVESKSNRSCNRYITGAESSASSAELSDTLSTRQGRAQDFFIAGAKTEAVSGEGQQPPPHELGRSGGSVVSSRSGVLGGAPSAQRFSTIFSTQDGLS